ncbi:MAG: phosphate regulon sensor histidine kinase PhoR [Rhodanobacter sp.]
MPNPSQRWRQPLLLAMGLALGAAAGTLIGGYIGAGVAWVAVAEIIFLLTRHPNQAMALAAPVSVVQADRSTSRHRRLAQSLRDLRRTVSQLPDAVVLLDQQHRVRWFNPAAETLLGLRRPLGRHCRLDQQLAGTALADWLHGDNHASSIEVAAPGEPESQLNLSLLPFGRDQQLLLARNVSHINRLEQVRRDFVANVSHELRTPLTVIHGYLELLDPEDVPELAPVLSEMRVQSRRMGQIVEDLLTLSRLETQHAVSEEQVPMAPLLASLHQEALALSRGRHRIELESSADVDLLGSAKDLHGALSNLVSNAVRYTPAGGRIIIRWQRSADGAAYSVSDSGFGISAAHLARLTERFYRVSSSRSRDSGGTGLGLSIVKHVLYLHQARLQIDSTPGSGSTFTCHFGAARLLPPEDHAPA